MLRQLIFTAAAAMCCGLVMYGGTVFSVAGDEAQTGLKAYTDNQGSLLAEYRGKVKLTCSTFWPGWDVGQAFDGDPYTSWFTAAEDTAHHDKAPWIAVEFPGDVPVRRVTVLTNREPAWIAGFSINQGRLDLLDKDGNVIASKEDSLGVKHLDMEFAFDKPVENVRKVRFTSIKDEGGQNAYQDVALAEVLVE